MMAFLRNLILLFLPFALMVLVNESMRPKQIAGAERIQKVSMNPAKAIPEKCTWHCHYNTNYCKKHHVKLLRMILPISDILYNLCLVFLSSGGGAGMYQLMNIVFLVAGGPFFIWFFLTRALNAGDRIREIGKNRAN